ncbi:MAG: host-nuclease inhibitor Gam family protein [Candidatus Alcyoniella australis]|nr:host-nuclease inhibitor Gam family protein [Candidatus Alcyoniella australis]
MSEPNNSREDCPSDPKAWTWEHIDLALHSIKTIEEENERDKATAEKAIRIVRESFQKTKKANEAEISSRAGDIRKAFKHLKKDLGDARSRELPWGTVGTREIVSVKLGRGVDEQDAVRRAESAGLYDVIKVEKRLLKEALKAKGAQALELVGCHLARQDRFFYETKRGVSRPVRKSAR